MTELIIVLEDLLHSRVGAGHTPHATLFIFDHKGYTGTYLVRIYLNQIIPAPPTSLRGSYNWIGHTPLAYICTN